MPILAYVLMEVEVGQLRTVSGAVRQFTHPGFAVRAVHTVTGPFDVIAVVEAEDVDQLGEAVMVGMQSIPGVKRTTTCLAILTS
jgi:DNA-binding Lrp family transcriptional regulator